MRDWKVLCDWIPPYRNGDLKPTYEGLKGCNCLLEAVLISYLKPTYEGLKDRYVFTTTGNINPNLKPTYEGLKEIYGSLSLATLFNLKPTYEGLKVIWHPAPHLETVDLKPTYEGLKALVNPQK